MSLPYFNMYPTDFEADTSHLSLEEDGAYNRLLRLMWMTPGCSLPDDDAWIMRRMRVDAETYERVVRVVLNEFFTRANGRVSNARLAREYTKSNDARQRRVSSGSKGGKAKALKTKETVPSNAKAMLKQPEPEPEPITPIPPQGVVTGPDRFEEFWSAYPHRNGQKKGKKPARMKWDRLRKSGLPQQTMIDGAKAAHASPDVKRGFARDPTTWLNQEGWADEIGAVPKSDKHQFHFHSVGEKRSA